MSYMNIKKKRFVKIASTFVLAALLCLSCARCAFYQDDTSAKNSNVQNEQSSNQKSSKNASSHSSSRKNTSENNNSESGTATESSSSKNDTSGSASINNDTADTSSSNKSAASNTSSSTTYESGSVVYIVDGDTLDVEVDGEKMRIRLIGIDAPESVHPDESRNTEEGGNASAWLKNYLALGTEVWLERDVSNTDKYGRYLRYVWLCDPNEGSPETNMLNAIIVANGYAQAKDYKPDVKYSKLFHSLE